MSTSSEPLLEFFSQFDFVRYTYDPDNPPLEEFERLCQARQWGAKKIRKHKKVFLLARREWQELRGSPVGPNVTKFFGGYEYQFIHDLDAPIQSEFQRLVGLRGWGERNLAKVTKRFNRAVALDERGQSVHDGLLPDWFRKQECPGYEYLGRLAEVEFGELTHVKRREWNRARREQGLSTKTEAWKEDDEFRELRTEFYEIVEKAFNSLLGRFCQITGFTEEQVLVGLYGPGLGIVGPHGQGQENAGLHGQGQEGVEPYIQWLKSISKKEAMKILKDVFINIFDFLDAFQEILQDPPTDNPWELLQLLIPLAAELQFPDNLMLGVYSALTHRVYPVNIAKEDGTLVLLLHRIRVFLKGFRELVEAFEEEAGDELEAAEAEGRVAIRALLLSREWHSLQPLHAGHQAVPF